MSDETRRILDLLAQGKITVDETDQLLRAMGEMRDRPADSATQKQTAGRFMRVEIHKAAGAWRPEKNVTLRVPVSLARHGSRLGSLGWQGVVDKFVNGLGGEQIKERLRERGIDFSKLDDKEFETMLKEVGELTVDLDQGKARVRISCE